MELIPEWANYEPYSATLQPFGGEPVDIDPPFPFGFASSPVKPDVDWWDDCGVVD